MSDSIDRQMAIGVLLPGKEILNRVLDDTDVVGTDREKYSWGIKLIEMYIDAINELPPVQPEYKLDEWCTDCKEYDHERHCCPRFNRVIRETLDEAQAERNTGKWIIDGHHIRCDQCGMAMCDTDREGDRIPRGFCPSCGVRMEE